MIHGMAGSAALVVLAAATLNSPTEGLIYVILFGLGSMCGMALFSVAIAIPMSLTAKFLTWANRGLQAATGLATMVLGSVIVLGS